MCGYCPKRHNINFQPVWKVSLAFMALFTAYNSMANLQSSINSVDGLGTWTLTATYAALVVSCLLLPAPLIARFTVKWTMAASMLVRGGGGQFRY